MYLVVAYSSHFPLSISTSSCSLVVVLLLHLVHLLPLLLCCRSHSFTPLRDSAKSLDWQKIKIQELEAEHNDPGRIPRTIECELTQDLVDSVVPGDLVTVAGIVKAVNTEVAAGRGTSRARSLFLLYVDACSISSVRLSKGTVQNSKQFSERELAAITEIANHPDPFGLIVASVCPGIYGHEMVKAGLIMGLFGGSQSDGSAVRALGNHFGTRSDPHVLVVGDPGLGKSQLLQAVANVAPRGVYVCGNTTSTTGLTVTMVKDSSGDFALEAGALVLGDQGICCIDEFDKMGQEHQVCAGCVNGMRVYCDRAVRRYRISCLVAVSRTYTVTGYITTAA
jgi:DNA helicase MCM8